jgi:very-short-patch-repair endonuclease
MQHCRFDAYIKLNKGKVAIEFDGSIHSSEDVKANDEIRDARLRRNGYIVLRFSTLGLAKTISCS